MLAMESASPPQVDLYSQWMPTYRMMGLRSSTTLQCPSPTRLLVHVLAAAPWPFANRDLCIGVEGIDCMDDGNALRQVTMSAGRE